MNKKNVVIPLAVFIIVECVLLIALYAYKGFFDIFALIIIIVQAILLYVLYHKYFRVKEGDFNELKQLVPTSFQNALDNSGTGILYYDDFYVITWMSDYLVNKGYGSRIGYKLLEWLPEVDQLFKSDSDSVIVQLDDQYYSISKSEEGQILFLKNESSLVQYKSESINNRPVLGMVNLDNFDESTRYEDETVISAVNSKIRASLINWCKDNHIIAKRIRNDRYYLYTTYQHYNNMVKNDRFSILKIVKEQSNELELMITLSMSFAFDSDDIDYLDEQVVSCMELAQQRGGDQVAVKEGNKNVIFFGGGSEASEKRSRVRARVISHALVDLINRSSNVILVGHKEADFDCIGSCLGMASIIKSLNKPCAIVTKSGGIEAKLKAYMDDNMEELNNNFNFVSEVQAINMYDDQSLVIMMDHNVLVQSNSYNLVTKAKRVAIIDHHRRPEDLKIKPILVYIESGCSSASELVSEFFSYMGHRISIDSIVATIMYAGIVVDTQRFKNRTGQRTFDAASKLLDLKADIDTVDQILKDNFKEFESKTALFHTTQKFVDGFYYICIAQTCTRSFMSQIADSLLDINDAKASFVIARLDDHSVGISARSNGEFNVQTLMEDIGGGGHRTAAAVQTNDKNVDVLKEKLKDALMKRLAEEDK